MLKKILLKLVGKKLQEKWNLQDSEKAPVPGEVVVSVPWYRSKSKVGFILFLVATILKFGPPAFGHPSIEIPADVLDLLQQLGLGVGAYGIRDAMKEPAAQLYQDPKVETPSAK